MNDAGARSDVAEITPGLEVSTLGDSLATSDFLHSPVRGRGERFDAEADDESGLPGPIGGCRIVRRLGSGGTGVIYEAQQESPERAVAVKLLHPGLATARLRRRFAAEARLLGRLDHPGIVRLFAAGIEDLPGPRGMSYRLPFLVLELVRGERLDRGAARLELAERLRLFARLCDAVDHVHRQGVIHRDLKPANVLVNADGQPKLLDFGIARATEADGGPLTSPGEVLGSLAYMSPEQLRGESRRVDARADVYALGVILFQLIAGRLPFEVSRLPLAEAAVLITGREAPPLTALHPFGEELAQVVRKAMAKERERRHDSAEELAAEVRDCLG